MADRNPISFDILKWAHSVLSGGEYELLLNELQKPLAVSIRANCLKVDPKTAINEWMKWYAWKTEPIPHCSAGYWLYDIKNTPGATITHRLGYFYIQEAASMLPVELFDFQKIEHPVILDMAASPGGKTTHLADRTMDQGFIVANDASRSRITALQVVLRNWGVINQMVTCMPGIAYGTFYPSFFDAVLLDAPCSMQGLRTLDQQHVRSVTDHELGLLSTRQKQLLQSALQAVKIGGQVVYATCSLTPHENEEVLDHILRQYPSGVEIQDAHCLIRNAGIGLMEYEGKSLESSMRNALRIWPHTLHTAGFFCAILKKLDYLPDESTKNDKTRCRPIQDIRPIAPHVNHLIKARITDQYGFNLDPLIEKQQLVISEIKGKIFLIPQTLIEKKHIFQWVSCGLLLGELRSGKWEPSHEFAARFGDQFQNRILVLEDCYLDAWLRGEDIRALRLGTRWTGDIVIVRDRLMRNLGRGKILNDRLKNLLPTRLF